MTKLIDDQLLLARLLADDSADAVSDTVATTGLWYHRLCRAVADDRIIGALSSKLGGVDSDIAGMALSKVIELPDDIELVSLRSLGWPMARHLAGGASLNLLSLEALAAAEHLGAEIWLSAAGVNPPLMEAASRAGIPVRLASGN